VRDVPRRACAALRLYALSIAIGIVKRRNTLHTATVASVPDTPSTCLSVVIMENSFFVWKPGVEKRGDRGKMGDADDFVYYNPTAGLAVGGGEEESPEEMSEAASAVYEMLLSSDSSILDMMLVMVELLGAREPLAAAPSPPLPPPPVPPPTPPPPPPPPSFLVTHLVDPIFVAPLCGIDRPMPLQALVSLVLVSKACRKALQGILEDRWVEALSSIVGCGEDPVRQWGHTSPPKIFL